MIKKNIILLKRIKNIITKVKNCIIFHELFYKTKKIV